jgi:hypothetical protein
MPNEESKEFNQSLQRPLDLAHQFSQVKRKKSKAKKKLGGVIYAGRSQSSSRIR